VDVACIFYVELAFIFKGKGAELVLEKRAEKVQ
jgi:hypothetical protein